MDAISLIVDAVPWYAVRAEFSVTRTWSLGLYNVCERIEKCERLSALLDCEQPCETHPGAAEIAEAFSGAFVEARLREIGEKGCWGEYTVVTSRTDVEIRVAL